MYQNEVILGDWEEVSRLHGAELKGHQVEIRILDAKTAKAPRTIWAGMLQTSRPVTEEDFRAAEWHGDPDDGL